MKTKENIVVKSDSVAVTLDGKALEGLSKPVTQVEKKVGVHQKQRTVHIKRS